MLSFSLESSDNTIGAMSSTRLLAKNALANLVRPGVTWMVVLVLPPLLVRVLDKPTYGTWMLLLQVSAYITIIDASVERVVMHFVARARGLGDNNYLTQMISSAVILLLLLGALAACACVVASLQLHNIFRNIPEQILPGARHSLLFIGCTLALVLPFATLSGIFRGFQRNEIPASAITAGKIFASLGIGWTAYHHDGLAAMAVAYASGTLLARTIYVLVGLRMRVVRFLHFKRVTTAAMREFFSIWSAMLLSQSCGVLITGLDLPVVAAFAFPSAAYYAIAATITSILVVPHTAIMDAVMPVMSGMSANASAERVGSALVRLTRYGTAALVLLSLPVAFGMALFLRVWVTTGYAIYAAPLALVLIIAQFIRSTMAPYAITAFGAGQQKQTLASPIAEGIVNLIASIILVQKIGAMGVAVGTLIGAIVGVAVHFIVSMRLTTGVKVGKMHLLLRGIVRPVLCAVPACLFLYAVARMNPPAWLQICLIAIGELIAAVSLFAGTLESWERAALVRRGKQMASKLALPLLKAYPGSID